MISLKKTLLFLPVNIGFIITLGFLFQPGQLNVLDAIYFSALLILAFGTYLVIYSKYRKTGIFVSVIASIPYLIILIIFIAFATADGDDYFAEGGMPLSSQLND